MREKPLLACAKCGTPIERPATGRPPSYCGEVCRRLIEFEVKRIDRRLAAYAQEQREAKFEGPGLFDDGRHERRLRALRAWIRTDEARLRELVGAGQNNQPESA